MYPRLFIHLLSKAIPCHRRRIEEYFPGETNPVLNSRFSSYLTRLVGAVLLSYFIVS
jgi:TATA-binding protein-associated factor Taf7